MSICQNRHVEWSSLGKWKNKDKLGTHKLGQKRNLTAGRLDILILRYNENIELKSLSKHQNQATRKPHAASSLFLSSTGH